MKLKEPKNVNYSALVISIKTLTELEGCDNVVGTPLIGFQAIVSKNTKVNQLGIVFPAETQLSEEFCKNNNLYRKAEKNKDSKVTGYIEDNRRVKAMKFRGHRSDCLFMPLESLSYIKKFNPNDLKEGDTFDEINGYEICKKYLVKVPKSFEKLEKNKNKFVRVDEKFLPLHYDSENYFRNSFAIPPHKEIIVTQKLHGTSIRIGNTIVKRKLGLFSKLLNKVGVKIQETEYDYVFGSRRVIKDANNPNQNHYYDTDLYSMYGKQLEGLLPKGFLVFAELIGWTPEGSPIQQSYTYNVPEKTADIYVYRVAHINPEGRVVDLSWDQVIEFCKDINLKHVPELWRGKHQDFKAEDWLDTDYRYVLHGGYGNAVPLSEESPCDEGVCIRVDGLAPYILKAKSPKFFEHETKMLDKEVVDIETVEGHQ